MSGQAQPASKPSAGKAFVIQKQSYQVNVSKNIPVVVATSSKKPNVSTKPDTNKKSFTSQSNIHSKTNDKKPDSKDNKQNKSNIKAVKTVAKKEWWEEEIASPVITFDEEQPWYSQYESYIADEIGSGNAESTKLDEKKFAAILQQVESIYNNEVIHFAKTQAAAGKGNSDQKWINDVIKSGTLSDKVAALALRIQSSPFHQLETLDAIVGMACKKEQRTAQLALEAIKDLLATNLLPDRKLVPFKSAILFNSSMNMSTALLLYFEGQLKQRVERIMEALDIGLKSNVDHFKKICLDIAAGLLMSKPEQEARLLSMITNKLGDPTSKTCSKCIETLKQILYIHPAMKSVVVREVRQFIYKPHNKLKSIFNGVLFLSQVNLVSGDHDVATQLVECYVSLFEKAVKEDELGSRLLSALLTGINKSFPYLDNIDPIVKYADSLFRLVHTASFTSSTQALMLLSHLAISNTASDDKKTNKAEKKQQKNKEQPEATDGESESVDGEKPVNETEANAGNDIMKRYYRALYAKLLSDQVTSRAKNTLLLNLLYRSIKKDPSDHRAMAFLKRLSICASHSSPSIAAGLLFLISEVLNARPSLKSMLTSSEEESFHTTQGEHLATVDEEQASNMLGNFDASKREPEFAASARLSIWEASLLRRHFHPSVQAFAHSLLDPSANHHINFAGDPTTDFSLMAFLNRFAYKNPKKSVTDKMQQRKTHSEEPINVSSFIQADEGDVAPDKHFFHKFFGEREKLREEGRSRDRSRHKKKQSGDSDDEEDGEAAGSDADEAEMDEFANKLAEDLMRENDGTYDMDPDMDDFSKDEDSDSDDSKVYDNPHGDESGDDDEGNSEAEEGNASDSDMGFDGMDESDSDDESEEEEEPPVPVKKGKKTVNDKSAALDFADFVKESSVKSKKDTKKSKKSKQEESSDDEDGYTGLVAYKEDEDEDLKPKKGKQSTKAITSKVEKKDSKVKDTKKASKKNVPSDDEDEDMDVMEFDDEGNCDNSDEGGDDDFDDLDEDEEFDLIMGNESNKKSSKKNNKKDQKSSKRKRGGDSDFASAEDYEAEMEAILKQIQEHSGEAIGKTDKKKGSVGVTPVSKVKKGTVVAPVVNKKARK